MPFLASKQAQQLANRNHILDFVENSVTSLLLEEFWRLNAIIIAFYTTNVVHGVYSAKQAQQLANRNHLLDFDEK